MLPIFYGTATSLYHEKIHGLFSNHLWEFDIRFALKVAGSIGQSGLD